MNTAANGSLQPAQHPNSGSYRNKFDPGHHYHPYRQQSSHHSNQPQNCQLYDSRQAHGSLIHPPFIPGHLNANDSLQPGEHHPPYKPLHAFYSQYAANSPKRFYSVKGHHPSGPAYTNKSLNGTTSVVVNSNQLHHSADQNGQLSTATRSAFDQLSELLSRSMAPGMVPFHDSPKHLLPFRVPCLHRQPNQPTYELPLSCLSDAILQALLHCKRFRRWICMRAPNGRWLFKNRFLDRLVQFFIHLVPNAEQDNQFNPLEAGHCNRNCIPNIFEIPQCSEPDRADLQNFLFNIHVDTRGLYYDPNRQPQQQLGIIDRNHTPLVLERLLYTEFDFRGSSITDLFGVRMLVSRSTSNLTNLTRQLFFSFKLDIQVSGYEWLDGSSGQRRILFRN